MAVVSWDEAIEAEKFSDMNRALDVVLPMAGAVREYNNFVVGTVLIFGRRDERRFTVLAHFLNLLFRFRSDLKGAVDGTDGGHEWANEIFARWLDVVQVGFNLSDIEREIASAFGLACKKTIVELVLDDYESINFESARGEVFLNVQLNNAVRSEPLVLRLFQDVEGFKAIDEVPLLEAVHNLTASLMNPDALIEADSRQIKSAEPLVTSETTVNDLATVDFTGATVFGPKEHKPFFLPVPDPSEYQRAREGKVTRTETLYQLQSGDWILELVEDAFSAPESKELKRLSPEQAARWLSENLYYSTEKLIVTFAELAKTHPPIAASKNGPRIVWNKDMGELTLDGEVVRKVRKLKEATAIVTILDVFQEENWPQRVDMPFTNGERCSQALKSLNTGLKRLKFEATGDEGIRWRLRDEPPM